jgi:hypothetical protein
MENLKNPDTEMLYIMINQTLCLGIVYLIQFEKSSFSRKRQYPPPLTKSLNFEKIQFTRNHIELDAYSK